MLQSDAESDRVDVGVRRRPHSRKGMVSPSKNGDDEGTSDLSNTWAIHISIECAYHIPVVKDTIR